jgi:chromosome segregation ATPase
VQQLEERQRDYLLLSEECQGYELAWASTKAELAQSKGDCATAEAEVNVLRNIASALKRKLSTMQHGLDSVEFDTFITARKFDEL